MECTNGRGRGSGGSRSQSSYYPPLGWTRVAIIFYKLGSCAGHAASSVLYLHSQGCRKNVHAHALKEQVKRARQGKWFEAKLAEATTIARRGQAKGGVFQRTPNDCHHHVLELKMCSHGQVELDYQCIPAPSPLHGVFRGFEQTEGAAYWSLNLQCNTTMYYYIYKGYKEYKCTHWHY